MFEGSLVESRGLVASRTQKWTALGSLTLQCTIAAVLIAIPMLRPEVLSTNAPPPRFTVPNLKPVQLVQQMRQAAASVATAIALPSHSLVIENTHSFVFPLAHPRGDDVAPISVEPTAMGSGPASLAPLASIGIAPSPVAVRPQGNRPMRVSTGVLSGMLLSPIAPVYPPIAKIAHVEGAVVINAVISTAGHIESLTVVSGPEMLRNAALEAVRQARYAPYKLNGDPVEVQTVITVVFRLGA